MIMRQIVQLSVVCLLLLGSGLPAIADSVDRDWEKETSERLAENVKATEVLWLEGKGDNFLALYTKQTNETAHGAVIILHAMGGHADWPQIVSPIRTKLPEQGWTTLSIQLPVIAPENQIEDYGKTLTQAVARIEAAIKYLHEQKFLNIVVVGHGFGAVTTLVYLEREKKRKVVALVALGLQEYAFVKPAINILDLIEKSKIPVLDIYGSRDFRNVINQAPDRRLAAKKGNNKQYVQLEIDGADHYFNKMEDILIKRIRGWLDKAAPSMSILVDEDFDGNLEKDDDAVAEP
jgi:pimeloyl-ACP methyl ester carboxylesterase